MKPLVLTLVIAVVATTIGAGWVITQFHSWVYNSNSEYNQNLITYKQLSKAIGSTLDDFKHRDDFISHWNSKNEVDINLQKRSAFPVPQDIEKDFQNGTPLLLESEGELSLHLYLQTSDQVMGFLLPIKTGNQKTPLNVLLTLLFYLIVVSVLLAWLYPLIKRLVTLQKAANLLGTGDLTSRVSAGNFSYISSIENDFNRMASQIEKLVDDNQLLSQAVSHNLKTPITRLRMGIDVLEEATEKSEINKYLKRINYDLDEMESLVRTLLQYSSLDNFKLCLENEPVDLCQFIPKLIEYETTTDIEITTYFSNDSVLVDTDPQYLAMCLANILTNATQHAKHTIRISVELTDRSLKRPEVMISVEDDGRGIPEADQTHVTKPFWRGTGNPAIKGHGMGLAIVARISEWLKADLVIKKSASLGGASVSLLFRRIQD